MFGKKKNIRILTFGTDQVDFYFLNEIIHCGKEVLGESYNVEYQIVQPNLHNINRFRNIVDENKDFENISFEWFTGSFIGFFNKFKESAIDINKYDFVHFVQAFYEIDSTQALEDTYNHMLALDGIVAVIGEDKTSFWGKMMHFLDDHKMEHKFFTCSGPVSEAYFLSGWLSQARNNDWKYHSYIRDYPFHITPLYLLGIKDSNNLLDYIFHVKDARNNLPRDIISDFMKFLDKWKKVAEGRYFFPNQFGAIMITKQ